MATFMMLSRWTDQGVENFKESPKRLDDAKIMWESMGAQLKQFYQVVGRYTFLIIFEAPDNETALKVAISTAAKGSARSELMPLIDEEAYRKLIASM